jgi:hypothetical protein
MNDNLDPAQKGCGTGLLATIGIITYTISVFGWICLALVLFRSFTQDINLITQIMPIILSLGIAIIPLMIFNNVKERLK